MVSRFTIILLISLILNAFLGAALVTIWLKAPVLSAAPPFDRLAARDAISDEYQEIVDDIWSKGKGELIGTVGKAMRKRQALIERLSHDTGPLDAELLVEAHGDISKTMTNGGKTLLNIFSSIVSALPAEERQQYFQAGFTKQDPAWGPLNSLHLDELDGEKDPRSDQ